MPSLTLPTPNKTPGDGSPAGDMNLVIEAIAEVNSAVDVLAAAGVSNATPQPLGTAVPGVSSLSSRDDHVHPIPTSGIAPTAVTGTAVVTSDSRLTDARTPTAHAASHASGGTDTVTPAAIGAVPSSEKGAANGVATLNSDSKLTSSQVPAIAISSTFVVASQAAMLALSTAEEGDVAVRTDVSKSFILTASPPATLGNWQELLTPTTGVASVDGRTGTVTLSDLYAPVTSLSKYQSTMPTSAVTGQIWVDAAG